MNKSLVGLDSLKLRLTDYEISSRPDLIVQPATFNGATGETGASFGLWRDGAGGYVYGARAFHNAQTFQLSVHQLGKGEDGDSLAVGCWVELSVPKFVTGGASNFDAVSKTATVSALKGVERSLAEIGVRTNIGTAAISRLDVFRNVESCEPFECYAPIFRLLELSRRQKRDYGSTMLYANKSAKTRIYDKVEEMRERARVQRKPFDATAFPRNVIRFEQGFEKPRKVRDTFGFATVRELGRNFGEVGGAFRSTMEKQLFGRSVADLEGLSVRQLEDEMRVFRARHDNGSSKSRWLDRYFAAVGVFTLAESYGVELVRQAVLEVSGAQTDNEKRNVRRIAKRLEEAAFDAAMLKEIRPSKRKLGELYAELQEKVLAP